MFRRIDYNALDREFRPGRPLSTEIIRQMVDLYLSGEGSREISPTVRVAYQGRLTQREYSSKQLKHSIAKRILVFKRQI